MEWLFYLLPMAALSGWVLARHHYKKNSNENERMFNPEYFKGLNYLLNEQPDKAIDIFIRLLEVNSETVETHFALANLFRRRGETDRAIRIHQNLIARPTLSSTQRQQALVELGLDYMNAGMLDRAEHLFLDLLDETEPPLEAYKQLVRIYEQEKKWPQAIEMAIKLISKGDQEARTTIAQFYCELAQQQWDNALSQTSISLKKAFSFDQNCVRASLLEADLHMTQGHYRKAIKVLLRIEHQNVHYLAEALPKLLICYQHINHLPAFNKWLESMLLHHPNLTSIRLMLTHIIQLQHGSKAAQDFLYQQLHSYPSVEGLHKLIALGEHSNPILVPLIRGITSTLVRRGHRYTCQNCGFSGKKMYWQCPSCKHWSSVQPTEIHLSSLESLWDPSS